jgi:hypothetical protein
MFSALPAPGICIDEGRGETALGLSKCLQCRQNRLFAELE